MIPPRNEPEGGLRVAVGRVDGSLLAGRVDHRTDGDRHERSAGAHLGAGALGAGGDTVAEVRRAEDDQGRYAWVEAVLRRFDYRQLGRRDRGPVTAYLQQLSGYSRAQLTPLVCQLEKKSALFQSERLACVVLSCLLPPNRASTSLAKAAGWVGRASVLWLA